MAFSQILFDQTGHLDISISDFGWWSCAACDQRGDDWTNPKDYPCTWTQPTLW